MVFAHQRPQPSTVQEGVKGNSSHCYRQLLQGATTAVCWVTARRAPILQKVRGPQCCIRSQYSCCRDDRGSQQLSFPSVYVESQHLHQQMEDAYFQYCMAVEAGALPQHQLQESSSAVSPNFVANIRNELPKKTRGPKMQNEK